MAPTSWEPPDKLNSCVRQPANSGLEKNQCEILHNSKYTVEVHTEQAPHFGSLWVAPIKSFKRHLKKVVGETRLTFKELTTITAQIEAGLNLKPLTPPSEASDNLKVLIPGHFLTSRPLEALPDPPSLDHNIPIL